VGLLELHLLSRITMFYNFQHKHPTVRSVLLPRHFRSHHAELPLQSGRLQLRIQISQNWAEYLLQMTVPRYAVVELNASVWNIDLRIHPVNLVHIDGYEDPG
jgi:DNA-binding helix-hairpin-helix protein with protein kinase domain